MTAPALERALPIRVPVATGESLDSWLEALARRNGLTIRRLLPALGWRPPHTTSGLLASVPAETLRRIERQAGLPPGRLSDTTLGPFLALGPVSPGSRYCPHCLAERDGRWLLAWRLPWIFACLTHSVLLCDTCPACQQAPRANVASAGLNPAAACPTLITRGVCCGADLRAVAPDPVPPGAPTLAAQRWIHTLLTTATTATTDQAAASARMLRDLNIAACWALHQLPAHHFAGCSPQAHAAWQAWQARPPTTRGLPARPPASAALAGAAAAAAMTLIAPDDEQAVGAIRALAGRHPDPRRTRPQGLPTGQWKQLSGPVRGRFLRAIDPSLTAAERIRHRSGTPLASIPATGAELLNARARHIPQLLWPHWAIRLMPAAGFLPAPFRNAIAACLLLPGNPAPTLREAITSLHAHRSSFAIAAMLRRLAEMGHASVFAAICHLASHLDAHGSPIDYQRRRDTISPDTIGKDQWHGLCYQASAHPGEQRRHLDARRYLYQLLTGADLNDPRHTLAFRTSADRANHLSFTDTMTSPLRAALHNHATRYLTSYGISEPLTWQPPPGCCSHLTLPGPDPAGIDLHQVRQLAVTSGLPPGTTAERLGTTIGHIRLALEHVPRPARRWGPAAAPTIWQWQQRADRTLTKEFFEREYLQARKTLRQIETETGFPRKFLAERAHQHSANASRRGGYGSRDSANGGHIVA